MVLSFVQMVYDSSPRRILRLPSHPTSNGICGALGRIKDVAYLLAYIVRSKHGYKERNDILLDQDVHVCRI